MKAKKILALVLSMLLMVASMAVGALPTAAAGETPTVSTGDYLVNPGDTIDVPIVVSGNPGIVSLAFKIGYDSSVLELVGKQNGEFDGDYSFGPNFQQNPYKINWMNSLITEDITTNGTLVTLTFKVKEDAAPGASTTFTYTHNPADVYNFDFEDVVFDFVGGTVTVDGGSGDGDEEVEYTNPTIATDNYTVEPGDTIDVPITVYNNPGIVSLAFKIGYDSSVLELVGKTNGDFDGDYSFSQKLTVNPYKINWMNALSTEDITTNGAFMTLTFKVKEDAAFGATSTFTYEYNQADICNFDFEDVVFDFVCGTVTVGGDAPVPPPACEHEYDNDCDADCNKCGAKRDVPAHVYDNDCDATCNVCEAERPVAPHVYDNACDADCNVCEEQRDVPDHVYDNACDTDCNECGVTRDIEHAFDNDCDADCNVCGAANPNYDGEHNFGDDNVCDDCDYDKSCPHEKEFDCSTNCKLCGEVIDEFAWHDFENICDNDCNYGCGAENPDYVPGHFYDDCDDTECNKCFATRVAPGHAFDNNCDEDCNNGCGAVNPNYDGEHNFGDDEICDDCGLDLTCAHEYDFDCSKVCNKCGKETRPEAACEKEFACDTDCKFCGEEIDADAVCTKEFECDKTCQYCGEVIDADAACAKEFECDKNCQFCGEEIDATADHAYNFACDTACKFCGETTREADHAWDHACDTDCNYACGTTREVSHAYDNACDADCNICLVTRVVPGHVFDNKCDADCNECGATRVVPAHVYDDECVDVDCNECGKVRVAPGHNFDSNGKCDKCGYELPQLTYRVEGNGVVITGLVDSKTTEVIIPVTITVDGVKLPVIGIASNAFLRCSKLTKVEFAKNLTTLKTIGTGAFYGCTSLTELVLPQGLEKLDEYALQLTGIKTLYIPLTLKTIGDFAFNNSRYLETVYYEGSEADKKAIAIGATRNDFLRGALWLYDAYSGCKHEYDYACDDICNLCGAFNAEAAAHDYNHCTCKVCGYINGEAHVFNDHYTCDICDGASPDLRYRVENGKVIIMGLNIRDVAHVKLPDTVNHMTVVRLDNNAFLRWHELESIVLPKHLEEIGISAFYACQQLTEIVIPETVKVIEEYALQLTGIKTITLPAALESVGNFAFNNCRYLKTVNYSGSEADRAEITIGATRNFYLEDANWNYNYDYVD